MKQIYDMLKLENIKILAGVKDWKEAIYTAVQPLVDGGYCEARYSDEIIKNTEKKIQKVVNTPIKICIYRFIFYSFMMQIYVLPVYYAIHATMFILF